MNKTESSNIEQKKTSTEILSIVLNILFYTFILFLLVFSISNLIGKDKNVPKLFNRYYMAVLTSSMDGDNIDSFKAGDMIVAKVITHEIAQEIEVGDIITFTDYTINVENNDNQFDSHRVVYIHKDESGNKYMFICQGDKVVKENPSLKFDEDIYFYDGNDSDKLTLKTNMQSICQEIPIGQVEAVYDFKIKNAGFVLSYLRSETGFALCIILPTALLFLLEAYFLVKNIIEVNKEKMNQQLLAQQEQQKADLAVEREKMKQELLAEMMKEKESFSLNSNKEV